MKTYRARLPRATACLAWVLLMTAPASAQYVAEAKLAEAKQLAGSVLRALQRCVQMKAGGACTLADVAPMAGVAPTGESPNGRWTVHPATTLAQSGGGAPRGAITITGVPGRDTAGLAVSFHVTPTGTVVRCETRSGIPPGPTGGQPC